MAGAFPLDLVGAGINAATGLGQLIGGLSIKKGQRPQWQIPGAASEGLAMARQQANSQLVPGQDQAIANINRQAGNGLGAIRRTAGSGQQAIAGAVAVNNNAQQAVNQNSLQSTGYRINAKQNLQNTLSNFANYQNMAFQKNQMDPYLQRVQTKNALIGAGIQNFTSAAGDLANNQSQKQLLSYLMK